MSLLWTERTRLFIGATETAVISASWRTRRTPLQVVQAFDGNIESIAAALAQLPRPVRQLDIVLSNHFARFQLLNPEHGVNTPIEREAWSALCFERDAGLAADSFEQRVSPAPSKHPALSCAIDKTHLTAISAACDLAEIRTITPLFVAVFNAWRKTLRDGTLAVAEPGRLVLGQINQGQWHNVATRFTDKADRAALTDMLQDYHKPQALPNRLWLYDPAQCVDAPRPGLWQTETLSNAYSTLPLSAANLLS